jgi:hypothetical protein
MSDTMIHLTDYIYNGYASKLNDIRAWEPDFPAFAAHVQEKGGLFENIVCFIDCHFQPVSRSGRHSTVHGGIRQLLLWNSYYKSHGLKYLTYGILIVDCPFNSKEHNNTLFQESKVSIMPAL